MTDLSDVQKKWGILNRESIVRQFERDQTQLLSFCHKPWQKWDQNTI